MLAQRGSERVELVIYLECQPASDLGCTMRPSDTKGPTSYPVPNQLRADERSQDTAGPKQGHRPSRLLRMAVASE